MDNDIFNDNIFKKLYRFFTNRLLLMFVIFCIMFYVLVARLFTLQIVEGEEYLNSLVFTSFKTLTIPAQRGTIYDRYGRPLAINTPAFTVKIDPSVQVNQLNDMLYDLIKVFESHDQEYVDEFPISKQEPFTFLFNDVESRELEWKRNMEIPLDKNAQESFDYLRKYFKISEDLDNTEARKIMQLRSMIHLQRYRQYNPITIAYGVEKPLVITIEEESSRFPGVYIDVESLREYPYGDQFSHIIGYIRAISDKELEANKGKGYSITDLYGKVGIERAFEPYLKGVNGEMEVEIDNSGRRVRTVNVVEPTQGEKIFLTVDQRLTEKTYEILKDELVEILVNKMLGKSPKEAPITQKMFFSSLLDGTSISIKKIMEAEEGSYSYNIRDYVIKSLPTAETDYILKDDQKNIKEVLKIGINTGTISSLQMIFTLYEQEIITLSEDYIERLKSGKLSTLSLLVEKLQTGEIPPYITNLDPSTGSVIVIDVKTGDVLASVSYPTYDNNEFVNNFNNEYYTMLNNDTIQTPMLNRPFTEAKAPGSTFKMLSAIAALEVGAIKPSTTIYDARFFTDAGEPAARCYASYTHGTIDVAHALEVSCNYFFCSAAYKMGNAKSGTEKESIAKLNEYMTLFGLNDRTGVEIGEYKDFFEDGVSLISGPAYKEYKTLRGWPDATPSQYAWHDGDTIRTAFGQSDNNYTVASMAKYIATLATGGERMQLHLMNKIETQQGELIEKFEPVVETVIDIQPENLNAVYNGMLLVTEGKNGTAKDVFANFPIRVAGKTGTAQQIEGRNEHTSFGGFAPYEDPQIAVYVLIPFGDTKTVTAPAAQVAKRVIEAYMEFNMEPEKTVFNNSLAK